MSPGSPQEQGRLVHLVQDPLAQIRQVVILGDPAVLDTIQTNAPLNGPVTAGFAALGSVQDTDLRFCWCVQASSYWVIFTLSRMDRWKIGGPEERERSKGVLGGKADAYDAF